MENILIIGAGDFQLPLVQKAAQSYNVLLAAPVVSAEFEPYIKGTLIVDVRDKERSRLLTDHRIHLDEMWYVDRDSIVFSPGEPAVMTLNWAVLEDYEDLCLRLEVWTAEDEHQADYVLCGIGDGKKGERKSLTLKADIGCFAPGTYKFKHTFFFRNGPDSVINTERVIGLSFTVQQPEGEGEYWDFRKMSHVRLDGIEILGRQD